MVRILVTGMSGAGKSTLLDELARRGLRTVDTDDDGWTRPDGRWDESRMTALLSDGRDVVVSGTVENQGRFPFDHVVLLTAPLDVLLTRVAQRDNPYGRTEADRDEIRTYVETIEPLLRAAATIELDGRRAVGELADEVERLARRGA